MFPDHEHAAGSWWVLMNGQAMERKVLEYNVPILVIVYHKQIQRQASSTKNKPGNPEQTAKPFQDLIERWDLESDIDEAAQPSTPAAPTESATVARKPFIPVEAVDGEEILPDVIDHSAPPPTGELAIGGEQSEIVPAVPVDWSSWDLGRSLRSLRSGNKA